MFDSLIGHMNDAIRVPPPRMTTPMEVPAWLSVIDQTITDRYAAYNGDCMEVLPALPDASIHLSIYSPPFAGLYHYSSSERDLSNSRTYEEFFEHYGYVVERDRPSHHAGPDHRRPLHGRPHRQHRPRRPPRLPRRHHPAARRARLRLHRPVPRLEGAAGRPQPDHDEVLAHKTIVDDSTKCSVASADYLLAFRKQGRQPRPVAHPTGLPSTPASGRSRRAAPYRGWTGKQTENRYSHWIWRQYASAFWDDVRLDHVLPFREARDGEDEKHVHPLQLDVIHRGVSCGPTRGSGC
jgi:hypothetical protein